MKDENNNDVMKSKRRSSHKKVLIILILCAVFLIGAFRINTYSPVGAIRFECLTHGHVISALFLQANKTEIYINPQTAVYKIKSFIPYERDTATHLDIWNVIKNKNGTYCAAYAAA
jgi:hypothetical protein